MAPRLSVQNLVRRFGAGAAVDDVSFDLAAGEILCLLGPSGCGKTTVLRCIAGVDTPDAGRVQVDGDTVLDERIARPPEERPIGLMFQDFALFPHLSVAQNVGFGLAKRAPDRAARIAGLLERVRIGHLAARYPHEISGGEQQRVALARSLAPEPRVILMDEPFSGLDNRLRDGVRDETLEILREARAAVLLVTHEPEEAMRMADRIALMRAGRVVQLDTPSALYAQPVDRAAAAFFSDINVLPGVVQGGWAKTLCGAVAAPGQADGANVEVVIRPHHVEVTDAAPAAGDGIEAQVRRARFLGKESLIELSLPGSDLHIEALVRGRRVPAEGAKLWLRCPEEQCLVFPTGP